MNTWAMQSGAKSVHDHSFAALRAIDNSRFHAERQYRHIGAVANAAAKLVGAYIRDFRARGYSVSIRSDKFFIRLGRLVYIRDMPRGPNEFFQASGIPFTLIRNPAFFKLMSNHRYWY